MSDDILDAMDCAVAAHAGQFDKRGEPYIAHVKRVAEAVMWHGVKYIVTAILHDVVEDGSVELHWIKVRFGDEIAYAVDCLTKPKVGMSYEHYINRTACHPIARVVKIADLQDNLRSDRGFPNDADLRYRYKKALGRLLGEDAIA